jgi:hypothetical protein
MAETNALRQLDPSSPTYLKEVMKISPEKGYAFSKLQQEAGTAELTQQKTRNEVAIQKRNFVQQAQRDTSRNPSDANVTAFKEDLMASNLFTDAEKAQMSAGADRILAMPVGERQAFMASQGATAGDLKPQVVGANASLVAPGANKPYFTAPAAPTGLARLQTERASLLPSDPRIPQYDDAIRKATQFAPRAVTNINVNNERTYGASLAGLLSKSDMDMKAAAQAAPAAAENANRILETLASGKSIAGAGADIKLGIAKLLNIAGADNSEIISNTEGMITSMAQNTLNAIKTSGLGTGQGFTDKDLKFLEAAKSGNINFQPDTIRRLAELSHKTAETTANMWNSRSKEIPKSAIQGTGFSLEPVQVPKRASSVTAEARPAGVGPTWTLHVDGNGNKAWVSPDRKQVKEVQ